MSVIQPEGKMNRVWKGEGGREREKDEEVRVLVEVK